MRCYKTLALIIFGLFCADILAERVVLVGQVEELHRSLLKEEAFSLTSPAGSYQKIFEVRLSSNKYKCLFFKVPLNEKVLGELISHESEKPCQLNDALKKGERLKKLKSAQFFDIDFKNKMSFKLKINNDGLEKVTTYFLPFVSKSQSFWRGFFPTFNIENKTASFINFKKGDVCHQGCGEMSYQCNKCPQSQWTKVLNLKCGSRVSGICGNGLCGGRGQAACVRMTALKQTLECEEAKEFVFCSFGHEVECQSNGEITCR